MVCKYWNEYDDENGSFEYCKLVKKSCYCCGALKQCNYQYKRITIKTKIKQIWRILNGK